MSTRSIGAFKESPIVALLDARQVGKTTLAQILWQQLGRPKQRYVDLESLGIRLGSVSLKWLLKTLAV